MLNALGVKKPMYAVNSIFLAQPGGLEPPDRDAKLTEVRAVATRGSQINLMLCVNV